MKRFVVIAALFLAGCALNPVPPLPPVQPSAPFHTGPVAWLPLPLDELAHYSAWKPVIRVPVSSGTEAQQALTTFGPGWPLILLVETVDDPLVAAIAALGPHEGVSIELGNELAFVQDADYMRAFYLRSIDVLHAHGWRDAHVITGGVANIEPRTIQWVEQSIQGVPMGVHVGWHAYSSWQTHRLEFVAVLGGRVCSMTEMGAFDQSTPALEQQAFDLYTAQLPLIHAMGCDVAIGYQNHDGGPGERFGFHALDGHWRISEQALKTACH